MIHLNGKRNKPISRILIQGRFKLSGNDSINESQSGILMERTNKNGLLSQNC
jgi:hypothetical protein